jgi:hypothetical protein
VTRPLAALLLCAACTPDFRVVGDPLQPLDLDLTSGVPQTRVRGRTLVTPAILDTGSPVSTLSIGAGCAPNTALVLNSAAVPDRIRLAFPDLHPYCVDGDSVVGGNLLVHYEAIFAGDRCGTSALGCLQLAPHEVESTRALSSGTHPFAVLSYELLGGGSFIDVNGLTHTWPATRVPMRVCINPPQMPIDPPGIDATLMVATGREPLTFTEAYMMREGLEAGVPVRNLVLVGHTLGGSTITDPGPCAEYARAVCLNTTIPPPPDPSQPRQCHDPFKQMCEDAIFPPNDTDSRDNCADVGAYVVLDGPLDFSSIADADPYIQSARNEVRPRIADVDGLLGASLLSRLEQVRIDYQGDPSDDIDSGTRLITRCNVGDTTCQLAPRHIK